MPTTCTFILTIIQQPVSCEEYDGISLALLPFPEHQIQILHDHQDPMKLRWKSKYDDGIEFAYRVSRILKNEVRVEVDDGTRCDHMTFKGGVEVEEPA